MKSYKLTNSAMIIALTVALNLAFGALSFGPIQIRISELLLVLCLFDKSYTLALTLACFLSNLLGLALGLDVLPLDFIFGSIATLVSCLLMISFKKFNLFGRPIISLLMPAIVNGLIIGYELAFYIQSKELMHYFFIYGIYVFLGEFVACTCLGFILYKRLKQSYDKLIKV